MRLKTLYGPFLSLKCAHNFFGILLPSLDYARIVRKIKEGPNSFCHIECREVQLIEMGKLLLRWIILAFSVFAASLVSQALGLGFKVKYQEVNDLIPLMIGVGVLAFLNATLGKILKVLTLPLSCLTLGLFSLVVNAVVLLAAASLKLGFEIVDTGFKAFLAALIASVIIAFINGVLGVFLPDDKDDD